MNHNLLQRKGPIIAPKPDAGKKSTLRCFIPRFRIFLLCLPLFLFSYIDKSAAVVIPATLTASQGTMTATTVCVPGFFASNWISGTAYWEYSLSTLGYGNIRFATNTSSSATGPHVGAIYADDGTGFVLVSTYTVGTTCIPIGPIDLSAVSSTFNNNPNVRVRLYMTGAINAGGTNRVSAQPFTGDTYVPPMPTLALLAAQQLYFIAPQRSSPVSPLFDLHYQYTNPASTPYYLNVYAMDTTTHNKVWAAENLLLSPFYTDDIHYEMNLQALFGAGQTVSILGLYAELSDSIRTMPIVPADSLFDLYGVPFDTLDLALDPVDSDVAPMSITDTTISFVNAWMPAAPLTEKNKDNVPNIDLDATTNPADSTYAGDLNACAPAACANSLLWLGRKFPGKIDTSLTQRNRLKGLSKQMNREDDAGVLSRQIVEGKLGFIDKYKLPLRVSFQTIWIRDSIVKSPDTTYKHIAINRNKGRTDSTNGYLDWDWLWDQMQKDADIEMVLCGMNMSTGKFAATSHCVMLTGISEVKGVRRLTYIHDGKQKISDSTALKKEVVTVKVTADGLFAVQGKDDTASNGDKIRPHAYALFSEVYDTTVKFNPVMPKPGGANAIPAFGTAGSVRFYPNPAHTVLFISAAEPVDVALYNVKGNLLSIQKNTREIEISHLPVGMYFIKVYDRKGRLLLSDKFLKE